MRQMMDTLAMEFNHEAEGTRKLMELLPEDKLGWKPHPKAFTLGRLAGHVANLPQWSNDLLQSDHFDLAGATEQAEVGSTKELMEQFEAGLAAFRDNAAKTSDEDLMANWQLRKGAEVLMEMPRAAVTRSFLLNHIYHHRGQLTVYLRQLDVALPPIYGPTADDTAGF